MSYLRKQLGHIPASKARQIIIEALQAQKLLLSIEDYKRRNLLKTSLNLTLQYSDLEL